MPVLRVTLVFGRNRGSTRKLKNIVALYKDQAVILRGDEITDYAHVIKVLDTCQKAGIWNIAFATRKPDADQPAVPK